MQLLMVENYTGLENKMWKDLYLKWYRFFYQ